MPAPDHGTSRSKPDPALSETLADAPAARRQPARSPGPPKPGAPRPTPAPASDSAMEETAADMDAPATAPDEADVDLNRIYDRPEAVAAADAASLARYDPEAGRTSVAVKVRAVTQAVRNTVATPFGKLIVTLPIILLGISLTIAAVTIQDLPYIIAAVLVMPVSLFLTYWRYQVWLGHKRYLYRLLETLGEDVSDFDPHRMYRKAGKRMPKRKR